MQRTKRKRKKREQKKKINREWSEKCRDWGSKKPRKPETLEKTYKNHPPGGPETPDPRWRGNSNQKKKKGKEEKKEEEEEVENYPQNPNGTEGFCKTPLFRRCEWCRGRRRRRFWWCLLEVVGFVRELCWKWGRIQENPRRGSKFPRRGSKFPRGWVGKMKQNPRKSLGVGKPPRFRKRRRGRRRKKKKKKKWRIRRWDLRRYKP